MIVAAGSCLMLWQYESGSSDDKTQGFVIIDAVNASRGLVPNLKFG